MSKNTVLEELASELENMPRAIASVARTDKAVILARLVRGLSREDWEEIREARSWGQWHALPVPTEDIHGECLEDWQVGPNEYLPVSPFREARGALCGGMFQRLLGRELMRLSRNGGCLSVLSAGLAEKRRLSIAIGDGTVARLEGLLGAAMLRLLEECDSLGILRRGQYICCLPGVGQLGARHFAEKVQLAFLEAARPFFPTGGISAGNAPKCAVGIVNILQGDCAVVWDLIKRSQTSLEAALSKEEGYIHQESGSTPLEGPTLVHSNEKRFLFFGGDQT